jgi:hypothetical protein
MKSRLLDLEFHLERGNHKSLEKYAEFIDPVILEDVNRGFILLLPPEILPKLPGASIAPLGCHKQTTIDEEGNTIPKYRLTHDQSFPGPSGLSVNLRVKKDLLPPIMYSFVVSRLAHYIINTRLLHPDTMIYLCKVDLDATYRRCSLSSRTAMECLTVYKDLLLIALRLTFGGAPGPNLWGVISESIADISNAILQNNSWNYSTFFDPLSGTIEEPLSLPDDIPLASAKKLSVTLPLNEKGYIDDNIGVTPDLGDNLLRMKRVIPLAIPTLARPLDKEDILPRKDIVSLKKFKAEGRLEEVKTVLGWIINTRTLTISLSDDKLRNWGADISKMTSSKKAHYKILESTLGRLNHVACVFNPMRHFMGRVYQALSRASALGGWTRLSSEEVADLQILSSFLSAVNRGLSLNNLVYRKPTLLYRSDTSEFGIGGYNLTSGIAWRLELPVDCRLRTSLNSLEFLACIISIWFDHIHQVVEPEACVLSQTDSTSALGWLRKTNFAERPDEGVQLSSQETGFIDSRNKQQPLQPVVPRRSKLYY